VTIEQVLPGTKPMRFSVDSWDTGYGSSLEVEGLADSKAEVNPDIEVDADKWAPVDPPTAMTQPDAVLFVDGVRRIDARVWIDAPTVSNGIHPAAANAGICASYAAGVVCCCEQGAHLLAFDVRRGLFTTASEAADIRTDMGAYQVWNTTAKSGTPLPLTLSAVLQERLAEAEIDAAIGARSVSGHNGGADDLLVVDGPLHYRTNLERTVGYIKSHQALYLPAELNAMVAQLRPGQRTPLFHMGGRTWARHSWYLRLPGGADTPWAGIVRLEAAPDLSRTALVELASRTQIVLGRYASADYKDSRAPQNLYPIGGLERDLRHLLGAPQIMYRALRAAAASR
jgi:hypothetical protein